MSKISLRAYNREIETLIERGHTEEAIAHCKYILKTYPKHLDTYRLLGKAFLENQRYAEAADILNRILSVIPDDFVAQIGMSIIREDEGNLDAAIFHMERAFEIQPSNAAIQDELRRLYGRRDGIEPPKLRLTRGALVRMYDRGDLYRQAIAEARAAVKEDPQRLDLEIVLARMYYQTGQKAEAAEICSRLVMKLPYCLEANRILADVLPETSRSDDAKIYQQRLIALEPYLAYQSDASQGDQQIPDNAVTLDHLEWIPSLESSQQPAWANTLGLEIDEKEEEQTPDWLSGLSEEKQDTFKAEDIPQPFVEDQESQPKDEVESSDWMPAATDETPGGTDEEKLPDWMQELGQTPDAPQEEKLPDWMQDSGWEIPENPSVETPASIASDEPEESTAAPADIPDWLKDLAPPAQEDISAETPTSSSETPAVEEVQTTKPESNIDEELPEWLKSPTSIPEEDINAISQEPLPDWLTETRENREEFSETQDSSENASEPEPSITETQPTTASLESDMLDNATEETMSPVSDDVTSEPSADLDNMDDAMAWLESLAAKQGAEEETLLTKPEERVETPPDWVAQASAAVEASISGQEEEAVTPEASASQDAPDASAPQMTSTTEAEASQKQEEDQTAVEEEPSVASEIAQPESTVSEEPAASEQTDQTDTDSAFAWLESLAAKQGAEPDSLLVSSEDRLETAPDWIQQETQETAESEEKTVDLPAEIVEESPEQLPDWMEPTDQIETPRSEAPAIDKSPPEWVKEDSITQENIEEVSMPASEDLTETTDESTPVETPSSDEPLPDWIKETESEDLTAQPAFEPDSEEKAPEVEPLTEKDELEPLPDWLSADISEAPEALEEGFTPETEPQALPDWLQAESPSDAAVPDDLPVTADEGEAPPLPAWLKDLESEQDEEPLPIENTFITEPVQTPETGEISHLPEEMILQAQSALGKSQIEFALSIYQRLIDQDQKIDEVIHDLRDALYRFPVDSFIWQTLGDAHMHANQVQEALDAFTKAEELLK